MLHPPPAKINTARRSPPDYPVTVPAARPAGHTSKCKSRVISSPDAKFAMSAVANCDQPLAVEVMP